MKSKLGKAYFTGDIGWLIYLAIATAAAHLLVAGNYGYFLDELYTIACSKHLSLAFVDIPPVAPLLLAVNRAVFGESLIALHVLPSLFSGAVVVITGLMAKELGGGKAAVVTAGIAAAVVPVWMALGSLFTYDFLDQFVIISMFYTLLLLIKRENPRIWLAIGAIAGIGLMTKPSMLFFIAALALALLLTRHRKQFLTPWPWLGLGITILLIAPALAWQAGHNFPIAEYWVAYSGTKAVHAAPAEFVLMQVVGMNFFLLPLWGIGAWYLLFDKQGRHYRLLGVLFVVVFLVFMATGAKMYMPIPAYAVLLAGGAVALEEFVQQRKAKGWRVLMPVYASLVLLAGLVQAPNFMPVLPVESLIRYYDTIGGFFGAKSIRLDSNKNPELPQYFYDRFEWDVLVDDVAEVYNSLPPEEQQDTVIVTQNYGWAGAIDLFGAEHGLPNAMCGQLNYYFFSLNGLEKKTWIMVGESMEDLSPLFTEVTLARISETQYRRPYETNIFICRQPKFTVEEGKAGIKRFQ